MNILCEKEIIDYAYIIYSQFKGAQKVVCTKNSMNEALSEAINYTNSTGYKTYIMCCTKQIIARLDF